MSSNFGYEEIGLKTEECASRQVLRSMRSLALIFISRNREPRLKSGLGIGATLLS